MLLSVGSWDKKMGLSPALGAGSLLCPPVLVLCFPVPPQLGHQLWGRRGDRASGDLLQKSLTQRLLFQQPWGLLLSPSCCGRTRAAVPALDCPQSHSQGPGCGAGGSADPKGSSAGHWGYKLSCPGEMQDSNGLGLGREGRMGREEQGSVLARLQ